MRSLTRVQQEMQPWQDHNFPGRPNWIPLMGTMEELGELVEHINNGEVAEIVDAMGDMCIYLCDFSNANGYNLLELAVEADNTKDNWEHDRVSGMMIELGKLTHAFIKTEQRIRMHEGHAEAAKRAIGRLLVYIDLEAANWNTTLEFALTHTWAKVKQRDWQKNRDTAHKQV